MLCDAIPGCVFPNSKISISGGSVTLGPTDWDSVNVVEKTTVVVLPFAIDRSEVTHSQFDSCVRAGLCTAAPSQKDAEPGQPITGISHKGATQYCAFHAGRLPTPAEWIFAASGADARRFPWGAHGLV
jgi:formylglycine-generating enzyme required for sulfatase activity